MMNNHAEPAGASWGQIFLIYALGVMAAATVSQAVPVIGDIARLFHSSRELNGYVISLPSAMVALGALLVGWIVDRKGDKPVLLIGAAIMIIGDIGVALSDSLGQMLVMRGVEGIGYVGVAVSTVTMVARTTTGRRRTTALTLWSSFVPMSFALPLLAARQLAGTGLWRWAFTGHAIAVAVLAILAFRSLPAWTRPSNDMRTGGLGLVLKTPAVYLLGLGFAAAAFLQTGVTTTLPGQLVARYGITIGVAGGIVTLGMLCNIAGSLGTGLLLNMGLGGLAVAAVGVVLALVTALGIYLSQPDLATIVGICLVFFLGSGIVVGLWALLPRVAPSPKALGATSGLVTLLTHFGVLFGPPMAFGALATGGGSRMAVNIVAAMFICIAAVGLALRTGRKSGEPAAAGVANTPAH